MAKELVLIIFTCIIWLSKYHINFQCDNANLVIAINKGSSEDKFVCIFSAFYHFCCKFQHLYYCLPDVINVTADHLSHGNMYQAFKVTPFLTQHPEIIPSSTFRLISPHTTRLDITWFSTIVPNNSIIHLLTHATILCTYTSQIYAHTQYDYMNIYAL